MPTAKFLLVSFVSILIISFFTVLPSFRLAFQDEDWRGVVLQKTDYANLRTSTYTVPVWFMDALYSWLGPNFHYYYILAFIFRDLLVFSILVFIYTITKDRLASYLGGLFMAVTLTGIQNSYEVMNIIAYISMFGLVLFLTFFYKNLEKFSFADLLPMGISLLCATVIASFRVFPVYAWVFMVDGLRVLMNFEKRKVKPFLIRQSVILLVFIFLYEIGIFSWYTIGSSSGQGGGDFSRFISDTINLVAGLNPVIASTYLKGLGNIIFPDIWDKSGTFSLLTGLILIILSFGSFVYLVKRKDKDSQLLFVFAVWPVLFYTLYFLIYVNGGHLNSPPLPSTMRYLLPPFIGLNIALAIFVSLYRNRKFKNIILGSVVLLIMVHSLSTNSFLSQLSKLRDGPLMMKVWKQIPQVVPQSALSREKMNVFYFETDGTPRFVYSVNDGFIGHALAVYKIDTKPAKIDPSELMAFNKLIAPPIITYEELVSYIKKSLSENPEPDIWSRIFTLKLEGENIYDIKNQVRKKVEASLNTNDN